MFQTSKPDLIDTDKKLTVILPLFSLNLRNGIMRGLAVGAPPPSLFENRNDNRDNPEL